METQTELGDAIELVITFERAVNFPRDSRGVTALARGLIRASETTSVSMSAIVQRWSEVSPKCPTDYDLMTTAEGIRGPIFEPLPKFPEKDRVPEEEFRRLAAAIDMKAVAAIHEKHRAEWLAVCTEWRRYNEYRQGKYPSDRETAEIRKRLGFALTPWDRHVLEIAALRAGE